jgi:hypothetical protein
MTPLLYDANTDRLPHPATPPPLGDAGTIVTDPTYGTRMLRLTDANTLPGKNLAFQVANEFWGNDWNADATLFYIEPSNGGGSKIYYSFDPQALSATLLLNQTTAKPFVAPVAGGGFSRQDPNILYGIGAGFSIAQYDFSTEATTPVVALATLVPDAGGYALGVQEADDGDLIVSFGGPSQGAMPYIATFNPRTSTSHVLDVTSSTLDGAPLGITIGGGVNTFRLDQGDQFVQFDTTTGSWIWTLATGTIVPDAHPGTVGWEAWLTGGAGGAYQWDMIQWPTATTAIPLITPIPTPVEKLASAAIDWENSVPGVLAPFIVETLRQPANDGGWGTWDDELLAVRTDGVLQDAGGVLQTEVWRFAHNFNLYQGTIYSDAFYYLYKPRVSQNGWFVLMDSNWNQGLGTAEDGGTFRTDVFVVALPNGCGP